MISSKLRFYILLSIPLFIAHGLEELFTGFADIDPIFANVFAIFNLPVNGTSFLIFQIAAWIALILIYLKLGQNRWSTFFAVLVGLIYFLELHHIFQSVFRGEYYSGLITALAFPVIGFFFWRELLRSNPNFK